MRQHTQLYNHFSECKQINDKWLITFKSCCGNNSSIDSMRSAAGEWANRKRTSIHEASQRLSSLSADNYNDTTSLDGQGVHNSFTCLNWKIQNMHPERISSAFTTSNVLLIQKLIIRSCPWELLCESNMTRHTRLTPMRMGAKMMYNNGAK